MSNDADAEDNHHCEKCRERTFCIINLYDERRHRRITKRVDVLEAEMAIGVIKARGKFFEVSSSTRESGWIVL